VPAVTCPSCDTPIQWMSVSPEGTIAGNCTHCERPLAGRIFPRFFNSSGQAVASREVFVSGKAACYNHESKEAVTACDHCGRFLCSLCELPLEGKTYCPVCMEKLDRDGNIQTFKHHETRHDSIAVALALLPLLLWPFTIITGPLTIVYIWKYWSTPRTSILPRWRWRFYVAGVMALIQCVGWVWLMYMLFRKVFHAS